jgi:hypothetical protein
LDGVFSAFAVFITLGWILEGTAKNLNQRLDACLVSISGAACQANSYKIHLTSRHHPSLTGEDRGIFCFCPKVLKQVPDKSPNGLWIRFVVKPTSC